MADYVRYRMERMTEELDDLEQRGLFSPAEISEIVRRRGDFEHRLKRPCPIKRDFLDYIDYEKHLDALRKKAIVGKLRKKREEGEDGDGKKNKKGKKGTKWRSGVTGVLRILDIYRLATTRYKGDLGLWFQYLEFCRQRRNGVMKKVAIMALEFGTRDKRQANVHYGNAPMPCVVEENFGEYYFDDLDDLALAEELQNQVCINHSREMFSKERVELPQILMLHWTMFRVLESLQRLLEVRHNYQWMRRMIHVADPT